MVQWFIVTSSYWVCSGGRASKRPLSWTDLTKVKVEESESEIQKKWKWLRAWKQPFLGGGVGANGERRLGTLARHMFVWDFAWATIIIMMIIMIIITMTTMVTFCRVFSPKLATRKIPLFRNGGESGSVFSQGSSLWTNRIWWKSRNNDAFIHY